MALILKLLYENTCFLFNEYKDPRNEHFPLMGSPLPIVTIIVSYLFFIKILGPKLMEDRKPFDLQKIINVYNIFQTVFNFFLGTMGLYYSYLQPDFSLRCQPITRKITPQSMMLLYLSYGFLISRILDLLDTIFFVLRKRQRQITFLHVYHHAGIIVGAYIFNKFLVGSHTTLLGVINSFVHVFMYGYYFLTSFNPELKQSIWWKRYITQIQLAQFMILIVHFTLPIFYRDCEHPKIILALGLVQNLFMFVLFSDFYYKAYLKTSKHSKLD